ncbi:MAG TPA: hypothetical protein VKT75_10080, partial [Acidobacteriaceae bacterium]|nr:hypothetical protein [Acidobacteriaceae bacterium]
MKVQALLLSGWMAAAVPGTAAGAQTYFPDTITFSGATQTQDQLLAFTRLHPGRVTKDEMQAASDRLVATGLFSDVRYTLNDAVLQFTLTPSPAVLPVRYDNFPWWDDKTLNALIAEKVPLFGGALYPGGPMRQQVSDVLEGLLAEKGVKAKVSTTPVADAQGTMIATRYHIDSPPVLIASLTVEGASDAWAAEMRRVEESAAGKDFRGATRDSLAAEIRRVYANHGVLSVEMAGPTWGPPKVVDGKIL